MDSNDVVVFGMCTKDEEATIRRTIESITNQSQPPDYVVICDDSEDSTPDIIRDTLESTDISFDLIPQRKYAGHGGARQELFENVSRRVDPDILCLLDAGHTVGRDWLKRILDFWTRNPSYDAVTGPNCGEELAYEVESPDDPLYYRHANISFRFEILREVGGWDPSFNRGEDWDLAIRLYAADATVYTSSEWCSNSIERVSPELQKSRIAHNPTSVPYIWKYGPQYVLFHPLQFGKDAASVLFYLLCVSGVFAALAVPILGICLLLFGLTVGAVFVVTHRLVATQSSKEQNSVTRSLNLLLWTAPAVLRSVRDVVSGQYGRRGNARESSSIKKTSGIQSWLERKK